VAVTELLVAHGVLGVVGLLVVVFVAFPYRGRSVPRAERLTEKVAAVAERVDPGEAPPRGVLGRPDRPRSTAVRSERAERRGGRSAKRMVSAGRD
jgi:hypothetical protein